MGPLVLSTTAVGIKTLLYSATVRYILPETAEARSPRLLRGSICLLRNEHMCSVNRPAATYAWHDTTQKVVTSPRGIRGEVATEDEAYSYSFKGKRIPQENRD